MTEQPAKEQEKGIPGWLELYDLSLHTDVEALLPKGAYIHGLVGPGKKFEPESEILGNAVPKSPETHFTPGWVELRTVEFHRDMEAVAPIPPYVHGGIGHFYPDEPFTIISS